MAGVKGKSGGFRKGAGRPKFEATHQQKMLVITLSALGTPIPVIAKETGIALRTLEANFKYEMQHGRDLLAMRIEKVQIKKAIEGDNQSAHFMLKSLRKERYSDRQEITGANGRPIETVQITEQKFTETARELLKEI